MIDPTCDKCYSSVFGSGAPCRTHEDIALDWFSAMRKYGLVEANRMFPMEDIDDEITRGQPRAIAQELTPCAYDGCPYPTNPQYDHDHPTQEVSNE